MTWFHFLANLDTPEPLIAAVAAATGESDVRLLKGYRGADRVTGAPLDEENAPSASNG